MISKWDSEFTEEKLAEQIKIAKEKYHEIYWKVTNVEYFPEDFQELKITLVNERTNKVKNLYFSVKSIKCLENKTDEEISKVSILGERAMQWEDLDIHIGLEKLLMSTQLLDEWEQSLK